MRGFGAPQTHFAIDVQMEMIAEALGLDPMELRLKNALKAGEETPSGVKIKSSALSKCIKSAAELAEWPERRKRMQGGVGLGMACNSFLCGPRARRLPRQDDAYAFSGTIIRAHGDGRVTVITGTKESPTMKSPAGRICFHRFSRFSPVHPVFFIEVLPSFPVPH